MTSAPDGHVICSSAEGLKAGIGDGVKDALSRAEKTEVRGSIRGIENYVRLL
jgi:hypothetical protein